MNALKKNNATNIRHAPPICGSGSRSRRGNRLASATPANTTNEKISDFKTKYGNSGRKFGLFAGHEHTWGAGDSWTCRVN
jgi:hypothetical protein